MFVRAVAAIPATALLAGTALALAGPDVPPAAWALGTAGAVGVLIAAWQTANAALLVAALWAAFCGGGSLLAADAWQRAWRPSVRLAFEAIVAYDRSDGEAARGGRRAAEDPDASAWLTGVLLEDASPGPNGVLLRLDVRSLRHPAFPGGLDVHGGASITVGGTLAGPPLAAGRLADSGGGDAAPPFALWRAGRFVALPAQLRRPSRYLNEGGEDAERSLARRGTSLVGSTKSAALVEVAASGGLLSEASAEIRARVRSALIRHVGRWSPRSAGIVSAIVIGDRTGLDEAVERRLQEAGTYHVIAISGGNIAILVGLTLLWFRIAGILGPAAMLTAIGGLISYGYIVGGGRSVERATLTAVLFLAGRVIDQRSAPANILAASAALLLAAQPLALADPGFLLTFGATVGILASTGQPSGVRAEAWLVAAARSLFRASLGAEAMLLPVGAAIFSRVTVAGLVLNFAAIPLMTVAQVSGMAIVPLSMVWIDGATAAGWVAHIAAEGLVRSSVLLDWAPWLTWRVAAPASWVVGLYYAALAFTWTLWSRRTASGRRNSTDGLQWLRAATLIAIGAAAWIVIEPWRWRADAADGRLHVTFIDVGQGDAAWVRFPDGATLLVDTGGLPGSSSFDIGDRVVAPVLRRHGVTRLDTLVLTHGDSDHIGGARSLLDEFRPREIWEGIPVPRLVSLQELRSAAARAGAAWRNVQAGDRVLVGDVEVIVHHPNPPDWERQEVRNEDSVVIEVAWRDVSIWLTGDIGRETESGLTSAVRPSRLRVVKAPHHGSLTSSAVSFVRALGPRIVVVSAGRHNTFGHPAPTVLDRYRTIGASIFRTDQDGAVTVTTDGHIVDVETVSGRRGRYR